MSENEFSGVGRLATRLRERSFAWKLLLICQLSEDGIVPKTSRETVETVSRQLSKTLRRSVGTLCQDSPSVCWKPRT